MPFLGTRGAASSRGFGALARAGAPSGQQAYTTAGTYSFVVPAGVSSICAVCVGSGSNGTWGRGGNGGDLYYANSIAVSPGETLTVQVGASSPGAESLLTWGKGSSLARSSTFLVFASGGDVTPSNVGDGGGAGGSGYSFRGGGGAGGYSGAGGNGGGPGLSGSAGSGGGGGGGGGALANYSSNPALVGVGGAGGGVGILGQAGSGNGGAGNASSYVTSYSGFGGSGGNNGGAAGYEGGSGGNYGGGGGAGYYEALNTGGNWTYSGYIGGASGTGAVRIIWGAGRSFPSTNTGNV